MLGTGALWYDLSRANVKRIVRSVKKDARYRASFFTLPLCTHNPSLDVFLTSRLLICFLMAP